MHCDAVGYSLLAPYNLKLIDCELPLIQESEILCQTLITAISPGTELGAYTGLPSLRSGIDYPRLLGYCNVARVIGVGGAVSGVKIGDLVLTFGAHVSHFVIPQEKVLYRLKPGDDPREIVVAYLYHLGYSAVIDCGIRAGSRVAVIGMGLLGLTSVAMSKIAGAEVIGFSKRNKLENKESSHGAFRVLSTKEPGSKFEGAFDGFGADVVITTSNYWSDWKVAMELAGYRATIACLGFPGRGESDRDLELNPLDSKYFYAKQLTIKSVGLMPENIDSRGFLRFNERANISYIANLISNRTLSASALISAEYPYYQLESAYKQLLQSRGSAITFLLKWQ